MADAFSPGQVIVAREEGDLIPDGNPLQDCPRCGYRHAVLVYESFLSPGSRFTRRGQRLPNGYTHWAMCSQTGQPILIRFELQENGQVLGIHG